MIAGFEKIWYLIHKGLMTEVTSNISSIDGDDYILTKKQKAVAKLALVVSLLGSKLGLRSEMRSQCWKHRSVLVWYSLWNKDRWCLQRCECILDRSLGGSKFINQRKFCLSAFCVSAKMWIHLYSFIFYKNIKN